MFRSKRNTLIRTVWKHRKVEVQVQVGEERNIFIPASQPSKSEVTRLEPGDLKELKDSFLNQLKQLQINQLKSLCTAVESKGEGQTDCVLIPTDQIKTSRPTADEALLILFRVLRWPELKSVKFLKKLVVCQSYGADGSTACGNPFHYGRIVPSDFAPPPYSEREDEQHGKPWSPSTKGTPILQDVSDAKTQTKAEEKSTSETEKADEDISFSKTPVTVSELCPERPRWQTWLPMQADTTWAKIAYWELNKRVGRLYEVTDKSINIFSDIPDGDGFCLGFLERHNSAEVVERVRSHIGYGFQLTLEHDGIWLYNRSKYAVFSGSPTLQLEAINNKVPLVKRVPSGYCLNIFDYSRMTELEQYKKSKLVSSLDDESRGLYCIRISFAKGWGTNYTRRFITSCPCWIEIYLSDRFLGKLM